MSTYFLRKLLLLFFAAAVLPALSACSPKYNWREVRGKDAPFVILMPDKPVSLSRRIDLNGEPVTMTMIAAEVAGVSFAVGYAELADVKRVPSALLSMKEALVKNIGGTIRQEKLQGAEAGQTGAIDIEAVGSRQTSGGSEPLLLVGHFSAKDKRVFQAVVLGGEKVVPRAEADTFISSFKLN